MTSDQWKPGDGVRLAQLIEVPNFDASYFWPNIPLLLVLGDEDGYAKTGIIRSPGVNPATTSLLGLSEEIASCPVSLDALVVPVCSKSDPTNTRPIMVGRSGANDVCLNHKSISKYHAQFIPAHGDKGWRIRDCGSLNGTWVEGLRVTPDDDFMSRGFADIVFGSLYCRFIHPPVLTALVRTLLEEQYERTAKDTDPDIPFEDLDLVKPKEGTPTETWGSFRPTEDLEKIKPPRQIPPEPQ